MKTILTIIALTTGLAAHAVTMPLIGLPLKPAAPKLAMKAAGVGKKVAAGMGFGAGVPYFCTGTRYECGLTGDPSDASVVTAADTGLRDIIRATSLFALDSSGNLYRRKAKQYSVRPVGNAGEAVNVHTNPMGSNTADLCRAGVAVTGSFNSNFGYCTPPVDLTGNDWELADTGVNEIFGGMDKNGLLVDAKIGWVKGQTLYVLPGATAASLVKPLKYGFAEPIVTSAAQSELVQTTTALYKVNQTSPSCSLSGSTIAGCTGYAGTTIDSSYYPLIWQSTNSTRLLVTINAYVPAEIDQISGSRTVALREVNVMGNSSYQILANSGNTPAECWANLSGYTFTGKPGYTAPAGGMIYVQIPGTGNIKQMWTGYSELNLQTTTGETWRLASNTGVWIKL